MTRNLNSQRSHHGSGENTKKRRKVGVGNEKDENYTCR